MFPSQRRGNVGKAGGNASGMPQALEPLVALRSRRRPQGPDVLKAGSPHEASPNDRRPRALHGVCRRRMRHESADAVVASRKLSGALRAGLAREAAGRRRAGLRYQEGHDHGPGRSEVIAARADADGSPAAARVARLTSSWGSSAGSTNAIDVGPRCRHRELSAIVAGPGGEMHAIGEIPADLGTRRNGPNATLSGT